MSWHRNDSPSAPRTRNKIPEVTAYFWIVKVLCTTIGESCSDYVDETLGLGLVNTTLVFTAPLVLAIVVQVRLRAYQPGVYWLVVVLASVVGTLLTDNLTDGRTVPLWLTSSLWAAVLGGIVGLWYARERTLSIHSIVTPARESFYWLTILVTFALGTAVGDWTRELTDWTPGVSILLPAMLIVGVFFFWQLGAEPVLMFWIVYVLTRPLGANLGDYIGSARADGGLGLGALGTSALFLAVILVLSRVVGTHDDPG